MLSLGPKPDVTDCTVRPPSWFKVTAVSKLDRQATAVTGQAPLGLVGVHKWCLVCR